MTEAEERAETARERIEARRQEREEWEASRFIRDKHTVLKEMKILNMLKISPLSLQYRSFKSEQYPF